MGQELIQEAEEAEKLARLVSYGPDKERLMALAKDLRSRAETSDEPRSWAPSERPRRQASS